VIPINLYTAQKKMSQSVTISS